MTKPLLTSGIRPTGELHHVIEAAQDYLAAGLDPNRCTLHSYLSMVMPLGELLRCPTFKEKVKNIWAM